MCRQAFKMSASCARPSVTSRSRDGDVAILTVLRQAWRGDVRGEVAFWAGSAVDQRTETSRTRLDSEHPESSCATWLCLINCAHMVPRARRVGATVALDIPTCPAGQGVFCNKDAREGTRSGPNSLVELGEDTHRILLSFHSSLCLSCSEEAPGSPASVAAPGCPSTILPLASGSSLSGAYSTSLLSNVCTRALLDVDKRVTQCFDWWWSLSFVAPIE